MADRKRPSTLTWRIARLVIAVVLIGGFVTALIATLGVRQLLLDSLDAQLIAAADQHEARMPHHGPDRSDAAPPTQPAPTRPAPGSEDLHLPVDTVTATIRSARVTDAVVSRPTSASALPASAIGALERHLRATSPTTVELPGLGSYRILVAHTDDGVLLTGIPQSRLNRTITKAVTIEAITIGGAALLMALLAALAVRRAMRPLQRLVQTAQSVSQESLDTGMPALTTESPDRGSTREVLAMSDALDRMLCHVRDALHKRDVSEAQLRDFIADASHELRTPVAIIRSHAELIGTTISHAAVPAQVDTSLRRIHAESLRMSTIVGDLLLLARLDHLRHVERQQVDLSRIVLEVVDDARVTAPGHRWRLDLPEESVEVSGDADQLRRAVLNLVTNAARHTPDGTLVEVSLSADPDDARVVVADDGPGIPAELQASIGHRFARNPTSPHPDSTGLGLALVDAIAKTHHGRLSITSSPGSTAVTLTIPIEPRTNGTSA